MTTELVSEPLDEFWNTKWDSLEDRFAHFIDNRFLSDMTFLVGREKIRIPGHKFIISSCSRYLWNTLKNQNNEILVEDVSHDVFMTFLRYCYIGKIDLNSENTKDILKLAYRFVVQPLIQICEDKLKSMITNVNCMSLLLQYEFLPKTSEARIEIMSMIAGYFGDLCENKKSMDSFLKLKRSIVEEIADLDALAYDDEMQLFQALLKWSSRACVKTGRECTSDNVRRGLNEMLYKVRFATLSEERFQEVILYYPGILTKEEITDVIRSIKGDTTRHHSAFSSESRKPAFIYPKFISSGEFVQCANISRDPSAAIFATSDDIFGIDFKTVTDKKLLGFAVIVNAQYDEQPRRLKFYQNSLETYQNLDIFMGEKYRLSRDYNMIFGRLKQPIQITSSIQYRLSCEFDIDDDMPLLTGLNIENRKSFSTISFQRIHQYLGYLPSSSDENPKSSNYLIPFLHFAK